MGFGHLRSEIGVHEAHMHQIKTKLQSLQADRGCPIAVSMLWEAMHALNPGWKDVSMGFIEEALQLMQAQEGQGTILLRNGTVQLSTQVCSPSGLNRGHHVI